MVQAFLYTKEEISPLQRSLALYQLTTLVTLETYSSTFNLSIYPNQYLLRLFTYSTSCAISESENKRPNGGIGALPFIMRCTMLRLSIRLTLRFAALSFLLSPLSPWQSLQRSLNISWPRAVLMSVPRL